MSTLRSYFITRYEVPIKKIGVANASVSQSTLWIYFDETGLQAYSTLALIRF